MYKAIIIIIIINIILINNTNMVKMIIMIMIIIMTMIIIMIILVSLWVFFSPSIRVQTMDFGRQRGFLLDGEDPLRRWAVERRVIFWSSFMLMLPGILLM